MMARLRERLEDRNITLELSDEGRTLIAREGFDPVFGARPLHRFIQREVETRVARALIAGEACDGAKVRVGTADGHLDVQIEQPSAAT